MKQIIRDNWLALLDNHLAQFLWPLRHMISYIGTDQNGQMAAGLPLFGMNVVGGPHQASKSVRGLAMGDYVLQQVDAHSLPSNASETLQARGLADIAGAVVVGAGAAALSLGVPTLALAAAAIAAIAAIMQQHNQQR